MSNVQVKTASVPSTNTNAQVKIASVPSTNTNAQVKTASVLAVKGGERKRSRLGYYHASALVNSMDALLKVLELEHKLRDMDSKRTAQQINAQGSIGRASAKAAKEAMRKEADVIRREAVGLYASGSMSVFSEGTSFGVQKAASGKVLELQGQATAARNNQEGWLTRQPSGQSAAIGNWGELSATQKNSVVNRAILSDATSFNNPGAGQPMSRQEVMGHASVDQAKEGLGRAADRERTLDGQASSLQMSRTNWSQMSRSLGNAGSNFLQAGLTKAKQEIDKKEQAEKEALKIILNVAQGQMQSGEGTTRQDYNKAAQNANDTVSILRDIAAANVLPG